MIRRQARNDVVEALVFLECQQDVGVAAQFVVRPKAGVERDRDLGILFLKLRQARRQPEGGKSIGRGDTHAPLIALVA